MTSVTRVFSALLLFTMVRSSVAATTWYVTTNGNDGWVGTSWATAKQTIQAAVDVAVSNDTVLVSNGVYATGGRMVSVIMTNRVAITNAVKVLSLNGPGVTVIKGSRDPVTTNGNAAVRCVYVGANAVLSGFTLTNGATPSSGSGGGAWCAVSAVLSNCTLTGNSAFTGAGSYYGTLRNCTLIGNSADYGGGSYEGTLNDCSLTGNSAAWSGGGARNGTLNNCTLTGNSARDGGGSQDAKLNNCTLTGNSAGQYGGGSNNGTLSNCTLIGNSAKYGGGSENAELRNCALTGNSAYQGGGSYRSTLNSCTLFRNSASFGGGSYQDTLNNCIVYYNAASSMPNYQDSIFSYSCTTPAPGGAGNITAEPRLASASHLAASSPCIGAGGSAHASGTDIDGDSWRTPPSMGCDELVGGSITGALVANAWAAYTNVAVGFAIQFRADISGRTTASMWQWGDGAVSSNQPYATHAFPSGGVYAVILRAYNESYPLGVAATVTVQVAAQMVHYVSISNAGPVSPYSSWATAATNIQDAIDVASQVGALVLVSNGVYAKGGRVVYGAMTNRVAITNAIMVRSVNGPAATVIKGAGPRGNSAVRCVYVGTNAMLAGFMLTNGATRTGGDFDREGGGGGAWCEVSAVLSNCTLTGNSAGEYGGGSYDGTLNNCTLVGNYSAYNGGGSSRGMLNNCTLTGNSADDYGGGLYNGTLNNCTLTRNSAGVGGGSCYGTLNNCTLTGNSANEGGGSYYTTLYNCTLIGNSARERCGGSEGGTLNNCIVYYNTASTMPNYEGSNFNYGCTTPAQAGVGNITNEPRLASASHLAVGSPCIGAGGGAYVLGADIDGESWLNPPSMGCDEPVVGSITGALSVRAWAVRTNVAVGFAAEFRSDISGRTTSSAWQWGDGSVSSNQPYATHAFPSGGVYAVILRACNESSPLGVVATVTVQVAAQVIHYVSISNAGPVSPYTSWATAATNIQAAIDAASQAGALVLVSDGVYATGGRVVHWATTNRVAITNAITVRSVNGPAVTVIQGARDPLTTNGDAAVRCAYVGTNALLSGFTLASGATREYEYGGGAWCAASGILSNCMLTGNSADAGGGSSGGTLNHCTLSGNFASSEGGGSYYGTLNDCTLTSNSASEYSGGGSVYCTLSHCTLSGNWAAYGGGASMGTLNRCTLIGNSGSQGGGSYHGTLNNCALSGNLAGSGGSSFLSMMNNCTLVGNVASNTGGGSWGGTLNNCIVYYNTAPSAANYFNTALNYSCAMPAPEGTANIGMEPGLVSASHLAAGSPCMGAGSSAYALGTDIDGDVWRSPPSMGCDERMAGAISGALIVNAWAAYTNVVVGFAVQFRADISGRPTASEWQWGDGMVSTNQPYATHAFPSGGVYAVILRAYNESDPLGVAATVTVQVATQVVHYVRIGNTTPVSPYTSWATAATNIQAAIDVASEGGALVLVSNGVYATGGRVVYGAMTNRVAITNAITVRSVNGPAVTVIQGARDPIATNGNAAVRCVYVGTNAVLSGFTLTNGATRTSGDYTREQFGGGAWCVTNAVLSNCTVTGNAAYNGGGAYDGVLNNCTLRGNSASAYGGGSYAGTLSNCTLSGNSASTYGGGSYDGTLNNCTLIGNSARYSGGGSRYGTLNNCTLSGNSVRDSGGASSYGTLNNCTLSGNSASNAGGSVYSTLNNSIVYYNAASNAPNYQDSTFNYSCTTPAPGGTGNITNDPQFVNAATSNYHLSAGSPCIDKGNSSYVQGMTDLDGNPRMHGIVDMGAYELQGSGPVSTGYWAWTSGIVNGLTNYADCATGDGYPNLLKYATGSSPTNSDELARLLYGHGSGLFSLFNRNTNAVDVTLIVEGASSVSNGATWKGIATNINGSWGGATNVAESGTTNPVTVRVEDPNPTAGSNRFLRLRVSRP